MSNPHDMAFPTGERKRPVKQAFDDGFMLGLMSGGSAVLLLVALWRFGTMIFGG